jgi:hypothetical protein
MVGIPHIWPRVADINVITMVYTLVLVPSATHLHLAATQLRASFAFQATRLSGKVKQAPFLSSPFHCLLVLSSSSTNFYSRLCCHQVHHVSL